MPIRCRKIIEDNLQELSKIACQIYIDDDEYYFLGINGVGMLQFKRNHLNWSTNILLVAIGFCLVLSSATEPYFKGFCGFDVFIWVHLNSSIYAEIV